ncbi:MAG TPA: phosphopentomutase [Nitrospiria bacterium]|nr:phosphopentomutase [Nitrospiria bacterium]
MRAVLIVLDGLGVGALPDAAAYGDVGTDTLAHIARAVGGLSIPNMTDWGIGALGPIEGVPVVSAPKGAVGKMAERSAGKDTTTGHWEMMGLVTEVSFPTYPQGFPPEVIGRFEAAIGQKVLGNCTASGTEIIQRFGEEHLRTGAPIVYTSADSVFQIAAHESVIPPTQLYDLCRIARKILEPPHNVGRVIARPFTGRPGRFVRTERRRDFSYPPHGKTLLDRLTTAGVAVAGIGKIEDLFAQRGIGWAIHTRNNKDGVDQTLAAMEKTKHGLIFTNLVDFDMLYGHRNNVEGYARALAEFDARIPELIAQLRDDDLCVITSDHGNDPTTPGTDHTREHVPLLVYGKRVRPVPLGVRSTFADLGQTLAECFKVGPLPVGESFLGLISR